MKKMIKFLLICLLFSCSEKEKIYTSFDYKTMNTIFKENTGNNYVFGVKKVYSDFKNIKLEVNFNGIKTNRNFTKKDDFWYSELNYRTKAIKDIGKDLFESYQKYNIYNEYILKETSTNNGDNWITYVDLKTEEFYIFFDQKIEGFDFNKAKKNKYEKKKYYSKDGELYEIIQVFENNKKIFETQEIIYGYTQHDIFFILDLEEYSIGDKGGFKEIW